MTTDPIGETTTETARALLDRHGLPEDVIDGALCLHAQELATVQRREADDLHQTEPGVVKGLRIGADLIDPTVPDDTDLTEADVDRMMAAGAPVQIVTAPPATHAVLEALKRRLDLQIETCDRHTRELALLRRLAAEAPTTETCRNCKGSGLDPRHNGEYACPDCPAAEAPGLETQSEAGPTAEELAGHLAAQRMSVLQGAFRILGWPPLQFEVADDEAAAPDTGDDHSCADSGCTGEPSAAASAAVQTEEA